MEFPRIIRSTKLSSVRLSLIPCESFRRNQTTMAAAKRRCGRASLNMDLLLSAV